MCVSVYMCVCMGVCVGIQLVNSTHLPWFHQAGLCMCVSVYICVCVWVCMCGSTKQVCVCMYVSVYICVCVWVYVWFHQAGLCMYVSVYICVCVWVYVWFHQAGLSMYVSQNSYIALISNNLILFLFGPSDDKLKFTAGCNSVLKLDYYISILVCSSITSGVWD